MKKILAIILVLILTVPLSLSLGACEKNMEYPVYLICGQSNANGNGHYSDLPSAYKSAVFDKISVFCGGGSNSAVYGKILPVAVVDEDDDMQCLGTSISKFGLEVGIADYFTEEKYEAGLIKCGFDGASINLNNTRYGTWWTESDDIPSGVIDCYSAFLEETKTALSLFTEQGKKPVIKGVFWMQGESNQGDATYKDDLVNLIKKMKADLSDYVDKNFTCVAGTISYVSPGVYSKNCAVNVAIRELADENEGFAYVESGKYATNPSDTYHWTGNTLIRIGNEFAETMLEKTK
ncbi:MAG: hypothetical protein IJR66_03770 [Clostridia bacterium]|nr:hypothetical protein [Clostridia bacterium]